MMSYVPAWPNPVRRTNAPPSRPRNHQLPSLANSSPAAAGGNGSPDDFLQSYQLPRRRSRSAAADSIVLVMPDGSTLHPSAPRQDSDGGSVVVVTQAGIAVAVRHMDDPCLQSVMTSRTQKRWRKPWATQAAIAGSQLSRQTCSFAL